MGIQITFSREAAINAGMLEFEGTESFNDFTDEGVVSITYEWRAIEIGERKFADYGDDELVCTDANYWGSNREIIIPWLRDHGIPFIEG